MKPPRPAQIAALGPHRRPAPHPPPAVKYSHRRILLLFVPVTLVLTPVGQYVGTIAPIPLMKMIAGVVVLLVAFIETHTRRRAILRLCGKKKREKKTAAADGGEGGGGTTSAAAATATDGRPSREVADPEDAAPAATTMDSSGGGGQDLDVGDFPIESTRMSFSIRTCNATEDVLDSVTDAAAAGAVPTPAAQNPLNDGAPAKSAGGPLPAERVKFGCNRVTSDTLVAGGLSGFLGGMIGIRTPPLMLYFLHPPMPLVFDNHSQRATGVVIMCTSTVFRQVFYLYDTFKGDDEPGYQSGVYAYQKEDWKLYVCVVVFSILGGWVGGRAFELVKNAKGTIRGIFLVLLYMCGASLFISALTA